MITTPAISIVPPTDFKLRLSCSDDSFAPATDYLSITFFTEDKLCYEVVSDPANDRFKNCKLDNGDLVVIFENYPFRKGQLYYCAHFRTDDSDFADGKADKYEKVAKTKIFFVK